MDSLWGGTGDRVAVEPGVPCEHCFLCDDGRYNLCEDVQFAGVYPYAGTIQRYKVHPAKWLHKCVCPLLRLMGSSHAERALQASGQYLLS